MLITCKECGEQVSERAPVCPQCGSTMTAELVALGKAKRKTNRRIALGMIVLAAITISFRSLSSDSVPMKQNTSSLIMATEVLREKAHMVELYPDQRHSEIIIPDMMRKFKPISELRFLGMLPVEVAHCIEYMLRTERTGWDFYPYRHHEFFTDGPNGGAMYIEIEEETSDGWLLVDLIVYRADKGSRADVYQMWSEGGRVISANKGIFPKLKKMLEQCTPDKNWSALNR